VNGPAPVPSAPPADDRGRRRRRSGQGQGHGTGEPRTRHQPSGDSWTADSHPIVLVETSALILDGSPRLQGEDTTHTRLLAETDATLPPILVHRATMRVIDGIHRVRAAQIKNETTIAAQFYDGSEDAAFVLAVEQNIAHGLPLSLADRKVAAARIITSHPNWSDRAIAASTGLSARTVRTIRERSTAESPQSNARGDRGDRVERIGRDGRTRPMNGAEGRHHASQIIAEQPTVALRAVAKAAGVSLGTAHDVLERILRGDDPVPAKQRVASSSARLAARRKPNRSVMASSNRDLQSILGSLRNDPSLRFTDAGRCLLRWLCSHAIEPKDWEPVLESVPPHCTKVIAELARSFADAWQEFARELEQRGGLAAAAEPRPSCHRAGALRTTPHSPRSDQRVSPGSG
jgi:ParB-like chromosome segregation protein Spo0J